ncbi:MAG: hypothetical protein ACLFVG_03010 [Candidatus Aminicenantes bacterium]
MDEAYIWGSAKDEKEDPGFILVYPFFLKRSTASSTWLDRSLPRLSSFFQKVRVEKKRQIRSQPDESMAKFNFHRKNLPHTGMALCSIHEKSGILYIIGAPEEAFEQKKARLITILESFQFAETEKEKTEQPPSPGVKYTAWTDPVEKAFSLEVPQKWKVEGGTFRRAAVDLVHVLVVTSPDENIRIRFNDSDIPVFTAPSPMLAMAGFTEGSWYSPGYGVRMLVKRYTPGFHFLKEYLQSHEFNLFQNYELVSQNDRPDVADTFNRIYSQFASLGISFTMHAGEVAFRYVKNSHSFVGYGLALTQVVQSVSMQGGTWSVPLLMIYTCPPEKSDRVHSISQHMFQSIKLNPRWAASQQQLTANVSQIVTRTNQEISRIINDSYWARQRTMDDIHRRFSNMILGVTDVIDPETGEKWKVEAGHNYYWRKDYTDQIVGTDVYERPDIDFSPLKEF